MAGVPVFTLPPKQVELKPIQASVAAFVFGRHGRTKSLGDEYRRT
jgi:hypothetical protein